jgi:hypothetical protein
MNSFLVIDSWAPETFKNTGSGQFLKIASLFQMESGEECGEAPLCAGCRLRITDKFYLCAVERKWHSACLKCVECGSELENEASCFEREGHIYCRDDYLRYCHRYKPSRYCRISTAFLDAVTSTTTTIPDGISAEATFIHVTPVISE